MAALFLFLLLLPAAQVAAADINVDSDCSLANAIREANGAAQTGSQDNCEAGTDGSGAAGADTITLTDNIDLAAALPVITSDITINGEGYTISGGDTHKIIVQSDGTVVLNNLNLVDGRAIPNGGAIDLTGGSLTLDGVFVGGSHARSSGGGLRSTAAALTIRNSAFIGNSADLSGGGLSVAGSKSGAVKIENSTIYGNTARVGGGLSAAGLVDDLPITLRHVTITGNEASDSSETGGGGIRSHAGSLRIYNSIVAGNTGGDCTETDPDVNIGNIIRTGDCGIGPSTDDPLLPEGPTRPEDGSPPYFALPGNSPAVNNAVDEHCLEKDQRGVSRPYPAEGKCDIGAYEYDGTTPARQPRQDSPQNGNVNPESDNNPPPGNNPSPLNQNPPPGDDPLPEDDNPPPDDEDPPPDDEDTPTGDDDSGSGGRSRDSDAESGRVTPTPLPTCLSLPAEIVVSNFVNGTQCQTVRTDAGIGNAAIVSAGYLDAVDVWGIVPANVSVCFRAASGRFMFLDASLPSPRVPSVLAARSANGWTCTSISRAGTVVLMPAPAPPADGPLSNCSATTTGALNLRAAPYGAILGLVPEGTTLVASERSSGYLQVSYNDRTGWISEAYVTTQGSCG